MSEGSGGDRRWLRPLGLFGLVLALSVGQPLVLVGLPFALLAFLAPGPRLAGLLTGAAVIAVLFAGAPDPGLWYLERGWALVLGGWFVAVTLAWPRQPFFPRALLSVAGGAAWCGVILFALQGWGRTEELVAERLEASAATSLELLGGMLGDGEAAAGLAETLRRTAEIQGTLFPALVGLASLAALGLAWWLHVRIAAGSPQGLGPVRTFSFPDPLIWALIGGLVLMVGFGWAEGWGRVGSNLAVFMGGIYALRGAGVLLFVTGGMSVPAAILVGVAAVLAPPLLLASAMAVGVSDSWFDLRARAAADVETTRD